MRHESATGILPLESSAVHIWLTFADLVTDPQLLQAYRDLLAPEEQDRLNRFVFAKHRHQYLIAHALLRTALSHYAPVAPSAWTFTRGPAGKPELATPTGVPPLSFNLSHTDGLSACAIARGWAVGVDVEDLARRPVNLDMAEYYFAATEVAQLAKVPMEQRQAVFLDFWTLKEAYVKARGVGLVLPLDRFAFTLGPGTDVQVTFAPELGEDPACWQFARLCPGPQHKLALAIHRPMTPDLTVVVRETVPLAGSVA